VSSRDAVEELADRCEEAFLLLGEHHVRGVLEHDKIGVRQASLIQPRVKGSRVPPLSSTQTDFVSRYSSMAAMPFSRPRPDAL
jgi:hypothetical protein